MGCNENETHGNLLDIVLFDWFKAGVGILDGFVSTCLGTEGGRVTLMLLGGRLISSSFSSGELTS